MIDLLWCGASGMRAQQLQVDSLANDTANINTPGYKKGRVGFTELYNRVLKEGGMPLDRSQKLAFSQGTGVKAASLDKDFSQGALINTGKTLDLAIEGKGFFAVTGNTGEWFLTRNGNFYRDNEGNIVNSDGYRLDLPYGLPPEADSIIISGDGTITAEILGEIQNLGELYLYSVPNPGGLEAVGNNLFRETEASGFALAGRPGTFGFGSLRPGYLEASNVNLGQVMTKMIMAQRAYEFSARAIKATDEMWSLANNMRG